jgi:hypothetical protein
MPVEPLWREMITRFRLYHVLALGAFAYGVVTGLIDGDISRTLWCLAGAAWVFNAWSWEMIARVSLDVLKREEDRDAW